MAKVRCLQHGDEKMTNLPEIVVRLIHIKGPLKGQIQEFSEHRIGIGRHPANAVHFPVDFDIVSRNHADIVREGNRFKLIDHSTNGTYVGTKKVTEAYLKDGDVLSLADKEKGPKISFLTEVREGRIPTAKRPPSLPEEPFHPSLKGPGEPTLPAQRRGPEEPVVDRVPVPLAIQFGPTLRSFKSLPVAIGCSSSADFALDHPGVFEQHAQIFFYQDEYWIKDLTGRNSVRINGRVIGLHSALHPDDQLALSEQGPVFRFLGGGRLVEDQ